MAADSRFWDRIAAKYARAPVRDEASYARKLEMTRAYLSPTAQVLEIGCGTGSTAIAQAPHAGHIRATDLSEEMLGFAREKARAAGVANLSFERAAVEEIAAEDGAYDMVMAHSLLHLLDDRDAAIARAWRWLKPGGVLVSSTMCLAEGFGVLRYVLPAARALGQVPKVAFFTAEALEESHRRAGFEIAERWRPARRKALFLVARKPA